MTARPRTAGGYTKGAFLNVLDSNPRQWESDILRIKNLPSLKHIEVWLEYTPVGHERSILLDMLSGNLVLVHGPFIHTSLATSWEELAEISIKKCDQAIECASAMAARVVTLHAGTYLSSEGHEKAFERLARRFVGLISNNDPVIALENMPAREGAARECLGRLDDLRLFRKILPDVHYTLDIGHCLQNRDDFVDFLQEVDFSSVVHIHLHDGRVGGRSHLPLGAGDLDLMNLLATLRNTGYSRHVSLETITPEDTANSWTVWTTCEDSLKTSERTGTRTV